MILAMSIFAFVVGFGMGFIIARVLGEEERMGEHDGE